MSHFDHSAQASWRAPLRRALLAWWQVAAQQAERGLVCANLGDGFQLHAWDVAAGTHHQVTRGPQPVVQGAISADGQMLYALRPDAERAAQGLGRYVRLPWAAEAAEGQDIAPQLAPYLSFYINECASGRLLGFMALNEDGFQMFALDAQAGGAPHLRYESAELALGPFLSYDGEISLVALSLGEDAERGFLLESYNTRTGESLHTLAAGEGLLPVGFVPRPHDMRFLAHDTQGVCWWNARTGQLQRLNIGLDGRLLPLDWSADGRLLLLRQDGPAGASLWLYRLADGQLSPLSDAPQGHYERAIFTPQGTILAEHQDAQTPAHLLELGGLTGRVLRLALALDDAPPPSPDPAPLARLLLSRALLARPGRYHGFGLALQAAGLALGDLSSLPPADGLPSFGLALGDETLEAAQQASALGLDGLILVDPSARLLRLDASALALPTLILQAQDDPQRPPLPLGGLLARWPSAQLQHYAAHDLRHPPQETILAALLRFADQAL